VGQGRGSQGARGCADHQAALGVALQAWKCRIAKRGRKQTCHRADARPERCREVVGGIHWIVVSDQRADAEAR
jgi:hypothetical protein